MQMHLLIHVFIYQELPFYQETTKKNCQVAPAYWKSSQQHNWTHFINRKTNFFYSPSIPSTPMRCLSNWLDSTSYIVLAIVMVSLVGFYICSMILLLNSLLISWISLVPLVLLPVLSLPSKQKSKAVVLLLSSVFLLCLGSFF